MERRSFIKNGLSFAALFALFPQLARATKSQLAQVGEILQYAMIDNDEIAASVDKFYRTGEVDQQLAELVNDTLAALSAQPMDSDGRGIFLPGEDVLAHISPFLEQQFEMFMVCNTARTSKKNELVAAQHIAVLRRPGPGAAIFKRKDGVIAGWADGVLWDTIPTSTGIAKKGSIQTFSGIFRINHIDSFGKLNTSPRAGMSYQLYIDHKYRGGRSSGVAIHGTPTRNHRLLGNSRASHGCMRVHPKQAQKLRQVVLTDTMKGMIPIFNLREPLPSTAVQEGSSGFSEGYKALIVMFDGYKRRSETA